MDRPRQLTEAVPPPRRVCSPVCTARSVIFKKPMNTSSTKGMCKLLKNFTDLFKKRRIGVVPDDFIVSSHASAEIALEHIPASNVNRICSLMIHWCDKN